MICVLRIIGQNLQEATFPKLTNCPYRADSDCIYYDVAEADTSSELNKRILAFLKSGATSLRQLNSMPNVNSLNLDIGWMISENRLMNTLELEPTLLTAIANLSLSISISTYKTMEE